jgi:hypothetical protein
MVTKTKMVLKLIAITNSVIIAVVGFLTMVMFKNNIGQLEEISKWIILFSLTGSIISKFTIRYRLGILCSLLFDIILIVYLYNPTDCRTIYCFLENVFDINAIYLILFYAYLVWYHIYITRKNVPNRM